MPWPLNNVTTENKYRPACTLEGGPGNRAVVTAYNNSIYFSLLTEPKGMAGQAKWTPEVFLGPGSRTITRRGIFGVKVRSAVAEKAAQVTIEIVGANE